MNELDVYLRDRCHRYPAARTKFAHFRAHFLTTLTPAQQRRWPRRRIIEALSARGYPIGRDSARVIVIGELSLSPPPTYTTIDGRLTLTRE